MSEWVMRNYTYTYALVSYKTEQEGDITDIVTEVNFNVTATDTSSNTVTFPWRFVFCKYTTSNIVTWIESAFAYQDRDIMLNHYAAQLLEGRTSDNIVEGEAVPELV
jgi:hypothetical protein